MSTPTSSPSDSEQHFGFTPNFSHTHSVTLHHPISAVFPILGTTQGHERVCRLSSLCTKFELFDADEVGIGEEESLQDVHVRTVPAAAAAATGEAETKETQADAHRCTLPRQPFTMTETVPLVFGLFKTNVVLTGTLTWDEAARVALYETWSNSGVQVWKLRVFEEADVDVEGNGGGGDDVGSHETGTKIRKGTKVSERIEGICPKYLRAICTYEPVSYSLRIEQLAARELSRIHAV
ncbi:hypothetical protein GYMLUDRAFT_48035 [Collybiopsis luxurians FD-317 M1]|uniref:Uncharacterized protein n=1 Tax=Collybiopsis luxurians FD-317 M1 TaxID=944289 RepID=A0A0D0CJB5_9AGAR|nr:hypothetical protein GYMLUDRAFT_48035 [Collybiopsis luxurians FD-317 M1]